MNFRRDVDYGARGEQYLARLLEGVQDPDTTIQPVQSTIAVTRPLGAEDWSDPQLEVAWQVNGELAGLAASEADLWVIDFGGVVMLCPVADLQELARQVMRRGGDEALQGDTAVRVLRLPFQEWVPSERFGERNQVTGLLAMSGPRLPVGLCEVPELDRHLFAEPAAVRSASPAASPRPLSPHGHLCGAGDGREQRGMGAHPVVERHAHRGRCSHE